MKIDPKDGINEQLGEKLNDLGRRLSHCWFDCRENFYLGVVLLCDDGTSSIHLLGLLTTSTFGTLCTLSVFFASAQRDRSLLAGHGRTVDANTVTTDAKKVTPNRDVTNERRCRVVMRIRMGVMTSTCDASSKPATWVRYGQRGRDSHLVHGCRLRQFAS